MFKFESVTSTNDKAINLIKDEKKEIGCVYANDQTKGRGTQGKQWISNEGNFFGSIFFPLKDNYPPFNEFSTIFENEFPFMSWSFFFMKDTL